MKMRFVISSVLFILFFAINAFAQTSIKAKLDKTTLTTDEVLTYRLTITTSAKKVPMPILPKFEGFYIVSQAQSSTTSFVKGGTKIILVYAYILAPRDPGKFKIGSGKITVEAKTYSSETFEIEVTQGKTKRKAPLKQKPSQPEELPSEKSEQPKITL